MKKFLSEVMNDISRAYQSRDRSGSQKTFKTIKSSELLCSFTKTSKKYNSIKFVIAL